MIKDIEIKNGFNSQSILSFISILLGILSVLFTFNQKINDWLNDTFEDRVMLLVIIFMVVIILILYKMSTKDDSILELKKDLKSETKELWKKYAQLHQFYMEQNLLNLLEIYVTSKTEVMSIQRYKYTLSTSAKGLIVKIQGDYNYIKEGTDINTVSQCYYTFNVNTLANLKRAYVSSKKSNLTENLNDDDYSDLIKFYFELSSNLTSKCNDEILMPGTGVQMKDAADKEVAATSTTQLDNNLDKIILRGNDYKFTEEDVSNFQLLNIVIKEIKRGIKYDIPLPPLDEKQLLQLKEKRKTGMDIAIFLLKNHLGIKQEQEIIEYNGYSESKKNRCYSYVQVENNLGENYVFVIAQRKNTSLNKKSQQTKAIKNVQDFIKLIEKEFYFIR